MPRFSIAVLYERNNGATTDKYLRHGVATAPSKEAAFGAFMLKLKEDVELKNALIVLSTVFELKPFTEEITK